MKKRAIAPKITGKLAAKKMLEVRKMKAPLPFNMIVPNVVTLLALSCGVSSMRMALLGKWEWAALFIILAAVFDGLDGRIARILKGTSKFGAELDSLSDFVSFGVAPAFVMYIWSLYNFPRVGWMLVLLLSICCALRLARFNTMMDDKTRAPYWDHFFVGLPAPGGAMVAIAPMFLFLETGNEVFTSPWLVGAFVFMSALLMASRVPTICVKKAKIRAADMPVFLVLAGIFVGFLFTQPWLTMSVVTIIYLITIPFSLTYFKKAKREYEVAK